MRTRARPAKPRAPFPWRRVGALLLIALPALCFLPGIGFDSSHPSQLARSYQVDGSWYYRVQPKDSLTQIAQRELGTFKRYQEIVKLNPGIKPRELPIGTVLRMPPKDPSNPDAVPAPKAPESGDRSPLRLLLSFAGLLGLVVLVVGISGRFERAGTR